MKLVTWNVNGLRAIAKKGFVEQLSKFDAEVVCLQETKAHPDQCEPDLINPLGRKSYWSSAKRPGYSGVATFCIQEPGQVTKGIAVEQYDTEGRFVITDHADFLLYNVYFPNGGSGVERHLFKQRFLKDFLEHLKNVKASGREIVVVGDYNVAHREIDVHDPVRLSKHSGFLPEERAWFDEFLDAGFVDLFRHFNPHEEHRYTWWDYRTRARVGNRGWRIDYICTSNGLLPRFKNCEILDDVTGSDHCPVIAEFQ